MPRKKREPIELVEETLEELATESEAEAEAPENLEEELELTEAEDEEVTTVEAVSDESEETVVEEKPKRKRARRSKKAEPVTEAEAEPAAAAFASESSSEEIPPADAPAREEAPAEARPAVTPAFDPANDPIVRQWEMIRTISESICANLEKASHQIQEMPLQVAAAFHENFRAPVARPAPITKIAVLAAGLALVLSVLSLSFAQAARQSVIAKEAFLQTGTLVRQEEPRAIERSTAPRPEMLARVDPPAARPRPVAAPASAAKKHRAAKKVR